ncbi:hypothetical protein U1Q18_039587 [Sarracenia purpurea var. burkii]
MALETVVFQEDPFSNGYKDSRSVGGAGVGCSYGDGFEEEDQNLYYSETLRKSIEQGRGKEWETNHSSPENRNGEGVPAAGWHPIGAPASAPSRRKRRRTKSLKNLEEMENQRMTHIAAERNRRKQMNDYLAVLRALMPPSYVQRGDQASIVGGAINYVKELEQLLQFLQSHHRDRHPPHLFADFFTFPQYSTRASANLAAAAMATTTVGSTDNSGEEKRSTVADIEVTMVESHASVRILSRRRPKQLLKMLAGFYSLGLTVLHLNVTAVHQMVLYSLSLKVEDDRQLIAVNEIATTLHGMMEKIQEESIS